jgi:hypothetical protein
MERVSFSSVALLSLLLMGQETVGICTTLTTKIFLIPVVNQKKTWDLALPIRL